MKPNETAVPLLADLHIHTTESDGTVTPDAAVKRAHVLGIGLMAITDHDTIDGNDLAVKTAEKLGVLCLRGLEISVNSRFGSIHVLGLGLQHFSERLEKLLEQIQIGRRERNPRIVRKLKLLGFDISMEEVRDLAKGEIIGRPHIAKALVNRKYAADQAEAFELFLNRSSAAYVERWRPEVRQAADAISDSGGIPVLAHPGLIPIPDTGTRKDFLHQLKSRGVLGLEVHYPSHSAEMHTQLESIACDLEMIKTGGSDFHGENKPGIEMGRGTCGLPILLDYVRSLIETLNIPLPCR
ncbi:PHP domain-containing protein [bacterium]|nr:PHP domain-containing protein [candidate division CSSED10-310 bacterium]